jgi:predicted Rossmann fold flavoprotein
VTERAGTHYDVLIVGAGAAGLMCALTAGRRGRRVLLLDHADKVGKKILISGGGRCNFTNFNCAPENFLSGNPHFCKSALARYTQHDFIALVDKHRIPWHEKTLGQLFCDGSARAVVAMLLAECEAAGVDWRLSHKITDISRGDRFQVDTDHGRFSASSVVLASGGLSIPKMGATGFAHEMARKFGLALTNIRPGLVPLTANSADLELIGPLSGVSVDGVATCGKTSFREAVLLTHRGLSGPAILQISSYWREGQEIALNMLPDIDAGMDAAAYLLDRKRVTPKAEPQTVLGTVLPGRLAAAIAAQELPKRAIGDIADWVLNALGQKLNQWPLTPSGTEGYGKAEVTLGGVDTSALSSKTLEVKAMPGLYVIGEAVDVTGWLGGYNFQWAWSSGWAAGDAV